MLCLMRRKVLLKTGLLRSFGFQILYFKSSKFQDAKNLMFDYTGKKNTSTLVTLVYVFYCLILLFHFQVKQVHVQSHWSTFLAWLINTQSLADYLSAWVEAGNIRSCFCLYIQFKVIQYSN